MKIEAAIHQFLGHLKAVKRRSPATIAAYRADLASFIATLEARGDAPVEAIVPADVNRWMSGMADKATTTVRRRLCALSSFFRVGQLLGYAVTNPAAQVEGPPVRDKVMPTMNDGQVSKLLAAANSLIEKTMILTLATTGVRRAELIAIRVEDVDPDRGRIRIYGKGGKEREVIISPELQRALTAYLYEKNLSGKAPLFPSRTGGPSHNSTLQRRFKRWLSQAGLEGKGLTIHSLRRYAATRWLRHGLSVPEIQLLLGHESPQTTARYLNVELARIQQHIAQLPPIVAEAASFREEQRPASLASGPAGHVRHISSPPCKRMKQLADALARLDEKAIENLLRAALPLSGSSAL